MTHFSQTDRLTLNTPSRHACHTYMLARKKRDDNKDINKQHPANVKQ